MKTLTKLITAALVAMFTVTILSTTPTYASSADVYCDGVEDEEKIVAVYANDTTINIHNDCVFTNGGIYIGGYTGLILQGNGNTISAVYSYPIFSGQDSMLRLGSGSSVIVNDLNFVLDSGFELTVAFDISGGSELRLNNVNVDGFPAGISLIYSGNTLIATNFLVNNVSDLEVAPGFTINAAIISIQEDNVINWISGRSDAKHAVMTVIGSDITINNVVLQNEDLEFYDDETIGMPLYVTTAPMNKLVNCGFPVGSQWDICPDTGSGTEEPEGGDNGEDIEAPGTGSNITSGMISASSILVLITVISGFAIFRRLKS